MARPPKLEVSAINIRISTDEDRDYSALIATLAEQRKGVRVYGDSYVAISYFDESSKMGILSKYTEIDIDGDWFDLEDFDAAPPEKLDEISIPESLRPNLAQFYFKLDEDSHVVLFSSYSASKSLSARSLETYFAQALRWSVISQKFGRVEADIIKSYDEAEMLLRMPHLKEMRFIIGRPNTDIGRGLAEEIEERLERENGDEYEEVVRTKTEKDLVPTERSFNLAIVASENGKVQTKSLVNGIVTTHTTEDSPLVEKDTYDPEVQSELSVFNRLASTLISKVNQMRDRLREKTTDPNG
ncbi:DUF4747 family protein [Hyphomonas atlantica corrig.]|uniref:DUF4747 family protein n=1 Tax=Hyphomonas atlantica TaxID=1280948 RepID=UPI0023529575|nr:DUF4747 family protein [Hyphomonas atlantica]